MGEEAIVTTIYRCPQLFGLNVETSVRPKWEYLTRHLGGTVETLVSYPAFITLSLPNRILPRHRFLVSRGLMPRHMPMRYLILSDANFAAAVAKSSLKAFEAFKKGLAAEAGGEAGSPEDVSEYADDE